VFLPQVFTPFSQADPGRNRSRGVLSLGLAICRELVEFHGGTIDAESAGTGQGTTFTIELPIDAAGHEKTKEATNSSEDAPDLDVIRNARLHLVEDDPATSNALVKLLQKAEINVTAAGTAAAAMASFETTPPDIIVSDIALPEEDGYQLLQKIRSREAARHPKSVPAIALTAFAGNRITITLARPVFTCNSPNQLIQQ
jgi:CheY-like chemotaxis protein